MVDLDLGLTTFDWVPETPRGYVRDLRVRWALEEAGLPYRVETPFRSDLRDDCHPPFTDKVIVKTLSQKL
jgi:glutathione S-transferase